jgi:glycine cleavage system regulatory protein
LVLTVVADDRPGLVDAISGVIEEHGGNWERSQMARLGGKFAGIVQVSVPDNAAEALRAGLDALTPVGVAHVSVEETAIEPPVAGQRFVLTLVGTDRPGLLHSVTASLAAIGASIEELETDTKSAPMSGGLLFEANATVMLPASVPIDAVRTQLEALAGRLMVDIELSD